MSKSSTQRPQSQFCGSSNPSSPALFNVQSKLSLSLVFFYILVIFAQKLMNIIIIIILCLWLLWLHVSTCHRSCSNTSHLTYLHCGLFCLCMSPFCPSHQCFETLVVTFWSMLYNTYITEILLKQTKRQNKKTKKRR